MLPSLPCFLLKACVCSESRPFLSISKTKGNGKENAVTHSKPTYIIYCKQISEQRTPKRKNGSWMERECVNVGTKCVCCTGVVFMCVYSPANPSLTPPLNFLLAQLISYPPLFLFFPPHTLLLSFILSHAFSPHPATGSEGSAEEESLLAVGHQWLTLSNLGQPQRTQQDISKGAQVQQCHSKLLAYSATLKIIIYFTDSVGIVGCTVADCEKYTFRCWKMYLCSFCIILPLCLHASSKASLRFTDLKTKRPIA